MLDPAIRISPDLAQKVFPQAAREWYADLKKHRETPELDDTTKEWYDRAFLKKEPEIKIEFGHRCILDGMWKEELALDDNGFARGLSISRDFGGSLYFNQNDMCCSELTYLDGNAGRLLKLSTEKARAFSFNQTKLDGKELAEIYIYSQHNIDHFPGALFLRNWAMIYINAAIREVTEKLAK